MQEFYRIFDGYDVPGTSSIHVVDHRGERCRLTGPGRPRDQHKSAVLVRNFLYHRRQAQLFSRAHSSWNDSQDHAHSAALLKNIAAEPAKPGYPVSYVNFRDLIEPLLFAVVHYREGHVKRVFAPQSLRLYHRLKLTIDANERKAAGLYVQIGSALAARNGQQ